MCKVIQVPRTPFGAAMFGPCAEMQKNPFKLKEGEMLPSYREREREKRETQRKKKKGSWVILHVVLLHSPFFDSG